MQSLKEGDSAILTDRNFPSRRVRITKVGRTNLYVGKNMFDRVTGQAKDRYGNSRLLTIEQHALDTAVDEARIYLRRVGVELDRTMAPERVLAAREALRSWVLAGGRSGV